jgi:ribonuclease R
MIEDPNYKKEKEKYTDPVPSREFILEFLKSSDTLYTRAQLVKLFSLTKDTQKEAFRRRLRAMERDGQVIFSKQGYELPERLQLISGTILAHPDGYGFLRPDDGTKDLVISHKCMRFYFHQDRVCVQEIGADRKSRRECKIVKLLEARSASIVGRLQLVNGESIVKPLDPKIFHNIIIPKFKGLQARNGDVVVVNLTLRPSFKYNAQGTIIEIIGQEDTPGIEIEIALRSYDLPYKWGDGINKQLKRLGSEISESDIDNRQDLRHLPFVTIDGSDSKDFDDAVYAEPQKSGGFKLWVAIADVSHYVKKGSQLDIEAQARGNSVYFPSQVLPMLPEELSNVLCSLNPHVDRLCMVCEMSISKKGNLLNYKFYSAVMHSHGRLIYEDVSRALLDKKPYETVTEDLIPHLDNLNDLYSSLHNAREERGAIGFETSEVQFVFNEFQRIDKIVPRTRNIAHKIIEECMILANVSAAKFIDKHNSETLYRVHESPSEEKIIAFQSFIGEKGLVLTGGLAPKPKDYAEFMRKVSARVDKQQIQTLLLRSMRQARYTPENDGHFGLALQHYAHFTSPIRRYPDLQLHRVIRYILAKNNANSHEKLTADGGYNYSIDELDQLGQHCSMTERRADEAAREVADWLKCDYMKDYIGHEFDATVVSVASFGFFARLQEWYIDGLVHITSLQDDYYQLHSDKQFLIGEKHRRVFRVGDTVKVRVASVNLENKQIDFVLDDLYDMSLRTKNRKNESSKKIKNKSVREQLQDGSLNSGNTKKVSKNIGKKKPKEKVKPANKANKSISKKIKKK